MKDKPQRPKLHRHRWTTGDLARQEELAALLAAEAGSDRMSRTAAIRVAVVRTLRTMKEKQ